MICYRDRTFCPFSGTCKYGRTCHISFTKEVQESAYELGLPVALFADKPNCYTELQEDDRTG